MTAPDSAFDALPQERSRGPFAAIVSGVVHAVALVAAALLWDDGSKGIVAEPVRDVGIRLVQADAVSAKPFENERPAVAEAAATSDAPSAAELAAALPTEAAPEALPEIVLGADAQSGMPGVSDLPGFGDAGDGAGVFPGTTEGDAELIAQEQAQIAASRPQGQLTTISLFGGASAQARSFVFAIDRSQSMGAEGIGALDAAAEELARAVAELDRTNRFQIVAYNRDLIFLDGERRLLAKDDKAGARTKQFIDGLAAFGPTEHRRALLSSLALSPEAIYLLTDGGDPGVTDAEIAQIHRIAGAKTTIHVICFGVGKPSDTAESLQRLAETCGGGFTFVNLAKRR